MYWNNKKTKNIKLCTFCPSMTYDSVTMTPPLSEITAHCVCSICITNFYCFERNGSPQMSTQKWSKRGENGSGHIKNNHAVLLCTETRRKQKILICVLFVLPWHVLLWQWPHLFLRSQVIVYAVFIQLIFIVLKGMVAPSFNIKTPVLSLLDLIECTSKPEGPF